MKQTRLWLLAAALLTLHLTTFTAQAQKVVDIIKKHPAYASCNYNIYPDSVNYIMTPPPKDKHPFYISHYGRHGSRYISNRKGYDIPYLMMLHADSLDSPPSASACWRK